MQIASPDRGRPARDIDVFAELVPLASARIVELGCGRAELTRAIAARYPDARITALEVDRIQHARNLASAPPPNVVFGYGSADAIPLPDGSCDVVLMAKSLHHVPVPAMDAALAEIARVLVPGGFAAFSEPVYAGEFNALMAIFHDEKLVREAAFAALQRAVEDGRFALVAQSFHTATRRFADFADFERRMIGVTHTEHRLTAAQLEAVRDRFARHLTPDGASFGQPMRIDVLQRPRAGERRAGAV
jgi:ubiquinone/menaquinone biosynthesis C-methylase UbiE